MIRHVLSLLFAALLLAIGCAQDLASLAPFPCAKDGTCPGGFDCTPDKTCVSAPSCGDRTDCGGTCVDTTSDETNCGACGAVCQAGFFTCCDSVCVGTTTSSQNCGACGRTCPGSLSCIDGTCGCPGGQVVCEETSCVDESTDPNNCGGCGVRCGANAVCNGGACACDPTYTLCGAGTGCVDETSDANNCGACGAVCTGGQICSSGACACPTGETLCSGTCANEETDVSNCGTCGNACPTGEICVQGACCGPRPGGGTCSIDPECGCALDGGTPKCTRSVGGPEHCVSNGTTPAGGSCTDDTDCGQGYLCPGTGVCTQICATSSDCLTANWACLFAYSVSDGNATSGGFSLCRPHCNLLSPLTADATHASCNAGQTCTYSSLTQGATLCASDAPIDGGTVPEACQTDQDCAPAYGCSLEGDASTGECLQWCTVGGTTCGSGFACAAAETPIYDNTTPIGFCFREILPSNGGARNP
jgi:hypothetical protein